MSIKQSVTISIGAKSKTATIDGSASVVAGASATLTAATAVNELQEKDEAALEAIYVATNGDSWDTPTTYFEGTSNEFTVTGDSTGWAASGMSLEDDIYGVHTEVIDEELRVVALCLNGNETIGGAGTLGGNNLTGILPSEIGDLDKCSFVNVKHNFMEGTLPWAAFDQMTSLVDLHLNGPLAMPNVNTDHYGGKGGGSAVQTQTNNYDGPVDNSLLNLDSLEWFEAFGDPDPAKGISGTMPDDFLANASNIKGIFTFRNKIENYPPSFGDMTSVVFLKIGKNLVEAESFPFDTSNLPNLVYFKAESMTEDDRDDLGFPNAYLSGSLPEFTNSPDLQFATFTYNRLDTGGFPLHLVDGGHPHINSVYIAWNNLSGTLPDIPPSNFGTAEQNHNLKLIDMAGNGFTGNIPESWTTSLRENSTIFQFGWNDLSGEPPQDWSRYTLRYLQLTGNSFTGSIPTGLPDARHLYFHQNEFTTWDGQAFVDLYDAHGRLETVDIRDNQIPQAEIDPYIQPLEDRGVIFNYSGNA